MTEIDRTERGFTIIYDPWGYGGGPYTDTAHVGEKPTHSNVLGPDGKPYKYKQEQFGFRKRD